MVMGSRTRLSTNAIACWARYPFFDDFEILGIYISGLFYRAIAATGQAFEAIVAVWIVTRHVVTPVQIL